MRRIEVPTPDPQTPSVFLVTNLPAAQLSDAQAADLYRRRWGVEVFFRTARQTLPSRRLKSRTPELARIEAEWLVLSLLLWGALTVWTLAEHGTAPRS